MAATIPYGQQGSAAPSVAYGAGYSPNTLPNYQAPGIGVTPTVNALNVSGQQTAQAARLPGEAGLAGQTSNIIGQELQGDVPQDVMNLLEQQGAEGATTSGGNPQAAYLRALGLTSLGQQQAGQANLSTALASSPIAPLFDPTTQLLGPAAAGGLNIQAGELGVAQSANAAKIADTNAQLALQAAALNRGGGGGGGTITQPSPAALGLPTFNYGPTGLTAYGTSTATTSPIEPGAPAVSAEQALADQQAAALGNAPAPDYSTYDYSNPDVFAEQSLEG